MVNVEAESDGHAEEAATKHRDDDITFHRTCSRYLRIVSSYFDHTLIEYHVNIE